MPIQMGDHSGGQTYCVAQIARGVHSGAGIHSVGVSIQMGRGLRILPFGASDLGILDSVYPGSAIKHPGCPILTRFWILDRYCNPALQASTNVQSDNLDLGSSRILDAGDDGFLDPDWIQMESGILHA